MGATLHYFMLPKDERSLFRLLARRELTVYPELVPPGYVPERATEDTPARLEGPAYYLALERLGPVVVHPVKRGPDRGLLEIEEIPSPVFHYERSLPNPAGELVGGRLWAELEVTDDPGDRRGKPYALKSLFVEIQELFRKGWRRSEPKGWWIGPHAAAAWKRGEFKLREPGHRGRLVGVWR
ncbi:MAG TPA: hypothetical protein VFG59_15755 [Anaeromyxobacter sp.]|nr:hypothetical protein [Anaeromyxobacter sp.]